MDSQVHYVFLFRIHGDLQTITFLESLKHQESEKQCLHLRRNLCSRHFGFSKWPPQKEGFSCIPASK